MRRSSRFDFRRSSHLRFTPQTSLRGAGVNGADAASDGRFVPSIRSQCAGVGDRREGPETTRGDNAGRGHKHGCGGREHSVAAGAACCTAQQAARWRAIAEQGHRAFTRAVAQEAKGRADGARSGAAAAPGERAWLAPDTGCERATEGRVGGPVCTPEHVGLGRPGWRCARHAPLFAGALHRAERSASRRRCRFRTRTRTHGRERQHMTEVCCVWYEISLNVVTISVAENFLAYCTHSKPRALTNKFI